MKTNSKAFQSKAIPYILAAIDGEGYGKEFNTDKERLQFLADCFKTEYVFKDNLLRYGSYQNCLKEWIMGLPSSFNIDYENHRIIELANEWGSIPKGHSGKMLERLEDRVIANWFNLIAAKTMQLFAKHNITSFYL